MFKNLRTSTKLIVLCTTFVLAIAVTIDSFVAEKQIAIDFARKELAGNRYLSALRDVYAAVLFEPAGAPATRKQLQLIHDALEALSAAGDDADGLLGTAEFRKSLAARLRQLNEGRDDGAGADTLVLQAIADGRVLAARIGDASNLALDPDLDSYYLQGIVVTHLPVFLGRLVEMHMLLRAPAAAGEASERLVRFRVLDSLLESAIGEITNSLAAAYRGNRDRQLRNSIDADLATMLSHAAAYRSGLSDAFGGTQAAAESAATRLYNATVASTVEGWASAQSALDRLLQQRVDGLRTRMLISLGLIGMLACLSIIIAVLTHRHIVRPLERLEQTASRVRRTRNYDIRIDYESRDEIGRLAGAFNEMLADLAGARDKELSKRAELAHATRLTSMGAMTASIAHEINQPLAAIVTSSNAGLRWLDRAVPDLDEARAALQRIAKDGHRASQVIGSIRALFRRDAQAKAETDINDLVREVLTLLERDLRRDRISVETELADGLPAALADRVQLQQVVLNLITNAAEAMRPVTERARLLRVRSGVHENDVWVTIEDSGSGIDADARERMFDAFFTTKASGMGLGLSICRSIIDAHGGRLSASPGERHGAVLKIVLPASRPVAAC